MGISSADVARAHGRLGRADVLIAQRRVLYSAAAELDPRWNGQPGLTADVLDNPLVRGHLGEVLGGRERLAVDRLRPVSELVAPGFATEVAGHPVRLASAASATAALADAVGRVTAELRRHGEDSGHSGPELLTTRHPDELAAAYRHLVAGVELAVRVAPELTLDLLPHIALFAVATDPTGRLGSASAREYPGFILIPAPRTAVEVAEALVHEGAHQLFFDLAVTREIFGPSSFHAPTFRSSWASARAPEWPLEQVFAAWHAYRCLEVLARCLSTSPVEVVLHADSLLPVAAARVAELGDWLRQHGSFLGAEAHVLIEALDGERPADGPDEDDAELLSRQPQAAGPGTYLREVEGRTLVATATIPPDLLWVRTTAPKPGR